MLRPIIESFQSSKTPFEVYQRMYGATQKSFFLDSVAHLPPNQNYSYLAAEPFLEVEVGPTGVMITGTETAQYPVSELISVLRKLFSKYQKSNSVTTPFFTGGMMGFLSYELAKSFEPYRVQEREKKNMADVPKLYFGFFKNLIVYDHATQDYHLVTHVEEELISNKEMLELAHADIEKLKTFFEGVSTDDWRCRGEDSFSLENFAPEISREYFMDMVRRAKEYIAAGDIYQANLSQRFSFNYDGSALAIYEMLRAINPSPFSSFIRLGELQIVSSSPERLVSKKGSLCQTNPIAGTRPRHLPTQDTEELMEELLQNEKERAEHIMLVDLERNDLGRVCEAASVRVEEMMTLEQYSHVIHIVSKIVGKLASGYDGFDLLQTMFPGGTVTGCPKIRCMEIIDELEPVARGLYTGSIGYMDFDGDLDFNIVIRTLVLKKNKGFLQVGAGIVHDSDPAAEYEETMHKGQALREALLAACR